MTGKQSKEETYELVDCTLKDVFLNESPNSKHFLVELLQGILECTFHARKEKAIAVSLLSSVKCFLKLKSVINDHAHHTVQMIELRVYFSQSLEEWSKD